MPGISHPSKPLVKWRFLSVVILGVVVLSGAAGYFLFRHDLLFLEGGSVVAAEQSWTLEGKVFFERDGRVQALDVGDVLFRSEAFQVSAIEASRRLRYHTDRWEQKWTALFGASPPVYAIPLAGVLVALLFLAAAVAGGATVSVRTRRRTSAASRGAPPEDKNAGPSEKVAPRLVRINDVVRFFFRLYRMQLKAPAEAPGKIEPLEPDPGNPGRRFRLGIQIEDDWKWRYMTIRPIGEATGSKSQCFYVIFDTHIVVKIPPVPIRDFSDYIRRIQTESEIARTLSPRKCIIPNVSVILRKIQRFNDADSRSAEQIEDDYIRLLERSPGLHHCLKIDSEFAFFMDLSRDYFLSHAMAGPAGDNMKSVMAEDAALLSDCRGFETRYGAGKGWICLELQRLFQRFTADLENAMHRTAPGQRPTGLQKAAWFHGYLCDPANPLSGGSPAVLTAAAELLDRILPTRQEAVDEYRRLAVPHARKVSFDRTRPMRDAMTTNLLDLLSWLARCRVAIRDLKPDNLMVSGDIGRYPTFLTSAAEFSIGLIDLETAVICPAPGQGPWPQPQLGGTPTYATPSHFLPNRFLSRLYTDLERVFFLQDWHAVTAIIFAVVTGKRLFSRSANLFPALISAVTDASAAKKRLAEVFCAHNARFWENARAEFSEKRRKYEVLLKAVAVALPEDITGELTAFFDAEKETLERRICEAVEDQDVIQSPTARRNLSSCSHSALVRAMERAPAGTDGGEDRFRRLFERLSDLKRRQERAVRLRRHLPSGREKLPVSYLLEAMFERACRFLSDVEGPQVPVEPLPPAETGGLQISTTLSYTHSANL